MKSNELLVSVGVAAYNEEKNIQRLIKSVISQDRSGYHLDKMLIISDGSTDKTVIRAKSIKSPQITILDFKERRGKSCRLNEMFRTLKSDVLVILDADIIIRNHKIIQSLVMPFKDKKMGLVGGNIKPLNGRNIVENAINCGARIYERLNEKGYHSFGYDGRILAVSKRFARSVKIPQKKAGSDEFLYLSAHKLGFKTKYQKNAVIFYKSPSNFKDYLKQHSRFTVTHNYFKKTFTKYSPEEYKLPISIYLREVLKESQRHPVSMGLMFLISLLGKSLTKVSQPKINSLWQIAESTKVLR